MALRGGVKYLEQMQCVTLSDPGEGECSLGHVIARLDRAIRTTGL
jgi:hypothetical protein